MLLSLFRYRQPSRIGLATHSCQLEWCCIEQTCGSAQCGRRHLKSGLARAAAVRLADKCRPTLEVNQFGGISSRNPNGNGPGIRGRAVRRTTLPYGSRPVRITLSRVDWPARGCMFAHGPICAYTLGPHEQRALLPDPG